MQQYNVSGMTCSACQARVEKAVMRVEGVQSCAVSLLTNSMAVEGDVSSQEIISAVQNAGYEANLKNSIKTDQEKAEVEEAFFENKERKVLKNRLITSVILLIPLMYFSMGHVMFDFPVGVFNHNPVAIALLQMLLTLTIMYINRRFFESGIKSVMHKAPNMDTLVALGSFISFAYSVVIIFIMTDLTTKHMDEEAMRYLHELYFESAAMILTLITVGKLLESIAKGKTTDALKGLMKLAPKKAVVLLDGKEVEISAKDVKIGDIFVVYPGESIPVDGIVIEGESAINEASLTGESIPVDKKAGDYVYAATINEFGFIKCQADKVGEDTTLSKIIQMVSDAATTKAPIAKIADQVSGIFVPTVISIAVITFVIWLMVGAEFGFALARGITVLVISCPCALGLATPVAIMVGNGVGAKNGILFKTAVALEETGKAHTVVFDKTGTITKGEVKVTDYITGENVSDMQLFEYAYLLEQKSEHPLGKAIVSYAKENYVNQQENQNQQEISKHLKQSRSVEQFQAVAGNGLSALIDGEQTFGGKENFVLEHLVNIDTDEIKSQARRFALEGKTPLFFATKEKWLGMIVVSDQIKEDSTEAIQRLKQMNIKTVMLTGDRKETAQAIGKIAGVDEVIAEVLPDEKEAAIRRYQKEGKVIMVGDGINDAPALMSADIGIAVGAGTDIAIDAADVVLVKNSLMDVVTAIKLSKKTRKNICENLFWAFIYNLIGIPLAAGVFIHLTGWRLNPMFGAAAMSLSSFCVVMNALRLHLFKGLIGQKEQDGKLDLDEMIVNNHQIEKEKSEEKEMTKTMKIEGMMCGHCEARVKKVLEGLEGVTEAIVSHENGTAVITCLDEMTDATLKEAVEAQDYKVTSIE